MSTALLLILLTIGAVALFLAGMPILLVFGAWSLGFAHVVPAYPVINLAIVSHSSIASVAFASVPLFIVVGSLINTLGVAEDIIDLAGSLVGWLPGATGNTAIYTAGIFAAITGSNEATTAAVGEALFDELSEEGYADTFAAATIASGGTLGIIIPPSVLFILYGIRFNVPIPTLFIAGLIPGLMMMLALSIVGSAISYRRDYGVQDYSFEPRGILAALWRSKIAITTIVLLLGGIYSGIFTPSESASVAAAYILITGSISRLDSIEQVLDPLITALKLTGIVVPIFVTSIMVQQSLAFVGLQDFVASLLLSLDSHYLIAAAMIVIMLLSGSFLASVPNMILVAPLLAPAAFELGYGRIAWGVIFMISDSIGFITPPYGLNLYVISSLTGIDYTRVARAAAPYLFGLIVVWLTVMAFPSLTTLLL